MGSVSAILPASGNVYLANRIMYHSDPPSRKDLLPKGGVWLADSLKFLAPLQSVSAFQPIIQPFGGESVQLLKKPVVQRPKLCLL